MTTHSRSVKWLAVGVLAVLINTPIGFAGVALDNKPLLITAVALSLAGIGCIVAALATRRKETTR